MGILYRTEAFFSTVTFDILSHILKMNAAAKSAAYRFNETKERIFMDYRNDNRTPRDRIDDEFFRRMLRDEEDESLRRGTRMGRQNDYRASRRDPAPSGCTAPCRDSLSGYPLGMVYSPAQSFTDLIELPRAHNVGTIFAQLDLPFYQSGCRGDCR